MAIVKPFKGLRPPKDIVELLTSPPYDVINSKEAYELAKNNEKSLLHITKSEINCTKNETKSLIYKKATETFNKFKNNKWLISDDEPKFYIYAQTLNNHTQYGIVGVASCSDYFNGRIKKHELTRPEKEDDRMMLTKYLNANIEPVFFTYKAIDDIDSIVNNIVKKDSPEYNFVSTDNVTHQFWIINNKETISQIENIFKNKVKYTYIADGHHRTAAAARIGLEKQKNNPNHTGEEPYNYFMAVHFPDNQLNIIDYNRIVKDLNGLSKDEFFNKLKEVFDITNMKNNIYKPTQIHEFGMYIDKEWYKLNAKNHTYNDNDPIKSLDVTILSDYVLDNILDIKDLRTTDRCNFIGGIKGLAELKNIVDNANNMQVAFALHPVAMKQLINIADSNNIMPPKTTWFEPKLRSGLVIYEL
jgi:uncharacterized protein (DUF1015 family)